MSDLAVLVALALPSLPSGARPIVDALIARAGCCRPADEFARSLGFRDRHQLRWRLERLGLPQLEELAAGIRLLCLVSAYRTGSAGLPSLAHERGRAPESDYRMVQRITERNWSDLQLILPEQAAFELGERWRAQREEAKQNASPQLLRMG